jgi:hypothetical protein
MLRRDFFKGILASVGAISGYKVLKELEPPAEGLEVVLRPGNDTLTFDRKTGEELTGRTASVEILPGQVGRAKLFRTNEAGHFYFDPEIDGAAYDWVPITKISGEWSTIKTQLPKDSEKMKQYEIYKLREAVKKLSDKNYTIGKGLLEVTSASSRYKVYRMV